MIEINPFCTSSCLAFRYVADPNQCWTDGIKPRFPSIDASKQIEVETGEEVLAALRKLIAEKADPEKVGIFLSSGIDSAILAALLPEGTRAYTIDFDAPGFPMESERAKDYAKEKGLRHSVVRVMWDDFVAYEERLMIHKKAPLHPVEVALYKASLVARADGVEKVFIGNGADSTFGGLDKLLSKDWTFEEFIDRYTFVKPEALLKEWVDIVPVYAPYKKGAHIDVQNFLKTVHGLGVVQAFENAISLAGLEILQPYEHLRLNIPLDIEKIRKGKPKYMLREVFSHLYLDRAPPVKVAFARPMDVWLRCYAGPKSEVFKKNVQINQFSGEQKYIIRCLDQFVQCLEEGKL